MSEIKRWSIKQVINGVVYFNQTFTATYEDYLALYNLLFLPSEIVDYEIKIFKIIYIFDKKTSKSCFFRNFVTLGNISTKDIRNIFLDRVYNGIKVTSINFYYVSWFKPFNIIKQGKEFEYYVSNYFKNQGYEVINNFEKGIKDEGIDIIAKKGNEELLLIQCKNWELPVISHKEIKEFLGNCYLFLYNHIEYRKFKKVRRIYITSNSNLDKSAKYIIKNNYPFVEYLQIPFKKEKL